MDKNDQENKKWKRLLNKVAAYNEANKEILNRISGLTLGILLKDLEEASKYEKGYYKNKNGLYMYVKGVEVTNDLGNLCRMGFNGEDRGVWIHYCTVDDRSVSYSDVPMSTFNVCFFNKRYCKPADLMHPTTKEDFETKVKEVIATCCADYTESVNPVEYKKVVNGLVKLEKEFEEILGGELPL